jgi:hypothetical protein
MEYLVTVFADRISAEAAYTALEDKGLSGFATILGGGYTTPDEYGLVDPHEETRKRALTMVSWIAPFGFAGGVVFNSITGLQTFEWAGVLGNQIIGGVLGAIGGAMGGLLVSGGTSLILGSGDMRPYRDRIKAGEYPIVFKADRFKIQQANAIMRKFRPESVKAYERPLQKVD